MRYSLSYSAWRLSMMMVTAISSFDRIEGKSSQETSLSTKQDDKRRRDLLRTSQEVTSAYPARPLHNEFVPEQSDPRRYRHADDIADSSGDTDNPVIPHTDHLPFITLLDYRTISYNPTTAIRSTMDSEACSNFSCQREQMDQPIRRSCSGVS